MLRIFLVLFLVLSLSPAARAEGLPFKPEGLHKAFNAAAKKAKLPSRLKLIKCGDDGLHACEFKATGNFAVLSYADSEGGSAEKVILMLGKDSNSAKYTPTVEVLMMIASPQSDKEKRKLAMSELFPESLSYPGEVRTADLEGARFKRTYSDLAGLMITVTEGASGQ